MTQPYEPVEYPGGVFAGMFGPPKPVFYETLRPLIERLLTPPEIERQKEWMQAEDAKAAVVEVLLRRVDGLLAMIDNYKQLLETRDTQIKQLTQEVDYWKDFGNDQLQMFCDVYDESKELETRLEKMEAEVQMCRKHPIVVERKYDESVVLPQTVWMTEWRAKPGFDKQAAILRIIGETGLGRMPEIKDLAAQEFGYDNSSTGSITKAIEALRKRGLLAMRKAEGGMQGRPPMLGWLTDLGQAAYVMLTNQPPVRSELATQSSHVSDAHMLLNLEAVKWLEKDGYEIIEHGHRHYLDGIRQAVPDLTTRKNGQIVYIEVERSGRKSSRPEKWINMCELTGGDLYVFCQYPSSQEQIAREVQQALTEHNLSSRLSLTNLSDLRGGLRGPQNSLWLEQFDIYPGMPAREFDFCE
jgi:hypothetical protein